MTTEELNTIVAAVVAELEKSGVDFDYKADQAKDDDLVFVIRGTAPNYQGVTVTWKGLLDIITAQATQAKNDAETAKNAANTILEQVQSKESNVSTIKSEVSGMKTSVESTKSQVEGMKNAVETTKGQVETMKTSIETTKEEVETMKTSVETSKSQVEANKSQVETMKTSIETTKSEVETLKSESETAKETATQKAAETTQAKGDVESMKASVEKTVADFNALAEEKKLEVQGVYQNDLNELKGDLVKFRDKLVTKSYNLVEYTSNGYVSINNSIDEGSSEYYKTTNFVDIKAGEKIVFSTIGTDMIRVYIGKNIDSTATGRIAYYSSYDGTYEGRGYIVYNATEDCVARMSCIYSKLPMIEKTDNDYPSSYEEYFIKLNDDIVIESIKEIDSKIENKADVIRSINLFKADNDNGYVNIQNILTDSGKNSYKTCDWIELKIGESIIFSAKYNFCRMYVGRNTQPTTSGGSRISYFESFESISSDSRYYLKYTATENCYIRCSTYINDYLAMVEKTSNDIPSDYSEVGDKLDTSLRVIKAEQADDFSEKGKLNQRPSKWYGKNVLVIGDSLTAANVWQKKLNELLGMNVTTHAKGGIGFDKMLDGDETSQDSTTQASGSLSPLSVTDVSGKDLIIVFGGYNHRGMLDGQSGDVYPTNSTTYGYLQYLINGIYNLLVSANNLKCRLVVITPHCAGKYSYIPYTWDEEYPVGSGRTGETLANTIKKCADDNRIPCLDLFHTSGINKNTWNVFSASSTPMDGTTVKDQLHLNPSVGYPYLGTIIAHWIETI